MAKGFDTTPKPEFLLSMRNQRWTVSGALAEFVDNSFGPGRGDADEVEISYDPRRHMIWVLDNGRGMEAVGRLFQLGNTIGIAPKDIGYYGSGGTLALLWLADRVTVWTLKNGQVSHDTVDWPAEIARGEFPIVSDDWIAATPSNTPPELLTAGQGTLIELHLRPERRFHASNVIRDLAQIYAPGLRMGKRLRWVTAGRHTEHYRLSDPLVLPTEPDRTVEFDLVVTFGEAVLPVYGKIGLIEGLSHEQSRVAVAYGPRVIVRTRDCYSSRDGAEKYLGTGVAGWLDLGEEWRPYLATTKDEMNDRPAWEALMAFVFERIKPLLKEVDSEELNAEFDEIALWLQEALNGPARIEVLQATRTEAEVTERTRGPNVNHEVRARGSQPGDGEATRHGQAVATVSIWRETDEQMGGELCRAEMMSDTELWVLVNRDHHAVQIALQAKPVNRLALNFLITHAIANEIAGRRTLLEKMFAQAIAIELDGLSEEARPRRIVRLLMDRVRSAATKPSPVPVAA